MKPPNIVYILADDMGYGDVSCLNPDSKIRTQHLDSLAAEGMKFEDAHASSAVCTPSRYSLLTGRYNWRSRLKESVLFGYASHLIEPKRMTVASFLGGHGYHCAAIGKWHLGWDWATHDGEVAKADGSNVDFTGEVKNSPNSYGFDYAYAMAASLDIPPYVYVENGKVTAQPDRVTKSSEKFSWWREGPTGADFFHADVLPNFTRRAIDYVKERAEADEPFFLYFPLPAPHTPIMPTADYVGKSGTNPYGDFCLQVDGVVGQLKEVLEREGLVENTIFIFTSDNGCSPEADFEELAAFGHKPSYVFRGHKADIYEGGHRVPFIIRWPKVIEGGSSTQETVCLSDLLATCADILGDTLPPNAGEDSVSNLPVWKGETLDTSLREATVHHSLDGSFSIRKGKWKLEMCPGSGGWSYPKPGEESEGLPSVQLYDLNADIGEQRNLCGDFPEIVKELTGLLTSYVENGRSTPGPKQDNEGSPLWAQLWWMNDADLTNVDERASSPKPHLDDVRFDA